MREVSAARGEIPGRRAYPGYLYSDLASLYERCGRIKGRVGSVTLVPVLSMPGNDITHPVPDLTGYITEGQIVLSPEVHAAGVYPPVDVLSTLSRLMRKGVGEGRTREDHMALAAQIFASIARARSARELADLIGAEALTETDRIYLDFEDAFFSELVNQRSDEVRSMDDTFERAWRVISVLPERELTMMPSASVAAHYRGDIALDGDDVADVGTQPVADHIVEPVAQAVSGPSQAPARGRDHA
jgi:V/A-type H+-transporting ATPase subunit B